MKQILRWLCVMGICSIVLLCTSRIATADSLSILGSNSLSTTVNVALPISDVQISGTSVTDVPVKLFVTSGTLQMSTTTGLTFTGGQTGSTLYFSGSLANVNAALATLTYTRASTGTDTLEVSLVNPGEVFFTTNNHLYKFISGNINWNSAKSAAEGLTAYGAAGYLATITSQEENDFVSGRLTGDGWIGGSDSAVEGAWRWVTGPESSTQFWSGTAGGSTVNGNYAHWNGGEPNQSGDEDCAETYVSSGSWNDLPCTATVSGYVVEFGTPGTLPTVVAKNVSITTTDAPVVNTLSPADNATGVTTTANLVLTFSRTVTAGNGNVLIKRTSNDSTVETIDVTSGQVTGGGTNIITINPNTTLAEGAEYYVTIPGTAFKDGSNNFYTGISSTTAWSFTTGDFTAPLISAVAATPASTTANITWTTNELASSKVNYGVSGVYVLNTAETDTAPRVLSHSITLSSLVACTHYHYQVVSVDGFTNSTSSTDGTFTTTGCAASEIPSVQTTSPITVSSGGSSSLTENNTILTATTPSNFTSAASTVVIQVKALSGAPVLANIGQPSNSVQPVGSVVFDVKAIINSTTVLDSFDAPVTITYYYSNTDIAGFAESSLRLYHYHGGSWLGLDSCNVNTSVRSITCTTPSFSVFALFGSPASVVAANSGGLGLPPVAYDKIVAPTEGFSVAINKGIATTSSPNVVLSFVGGADAKSMAISNNPDFASVGIEPYVQNKNWTLLSGAGQKTVYVKFYNSWGHVSDVVSDTITLDFSSSELRAMPKQTTLPFLKNLQIGVVHGDVLRLQQFLNTHGAQVAESGPGAPGKETTKFSLATRAALIQYQEAHAADILKPLRLTKGTGYLGVSTRNYINKHIQD